MHCGTRGRFGRVTGQQQNAAQASQDQQQEDGEKAKGHDGEPCMQAFWPVDKK